MYQDILKKNFWKNKKILVTGHTGFKGGWLCMFLHFLGCKVSGYGLNPTGTNNFFNSVKIKKILKNDFRKNIQNLKDLEKSISLSKPEVIFHLAAQSSVIESFRDSNNTVLTNVIGTANILELAKKFKFIKSIIIITTDKVYQNYNKLKYFDEKSQLGGDDIYSGSKACCELLVHSYRKSFFKNSKCNIATVRAGNCFGGGDWTPDRIVKDILENFYDNKYLILRNPNATRPWQHVLEPLFGYLVLAQKLSSKSGKDYAEAWNFGPSLKQNMKVINLAKIFLKKMNSKSNILIKKKDKRFNNKKLSIFESKYLNIDSNKIFRKLSWKPRLTINDSVDLTIQWYKSFRNKKDLYKLTNQQIKNYLSL